MPATAPSRPVHVTVAALLGSLDDRPDHRGRRYVWLANAVARAVERGDVPRGARLPAERALAEALRVARGTVVSAYDLLAQRGLVERRQGSGTWVVDPDAAPTSPYDLAAGMRARQLSGRFFGADDDVIDLALAVILGPTDLPDVAFRIDRDDVTKLAAGHGYHPLGLPALRERIAEIHTDLGLPTDASQVAVTLGGQQAIALTAQLLLEPGDRVLVDSCTYPGAIDVYARAGARFETVANDSGGVRPTDVARTVSRCSPRLAYLVPTCHNPTGSIMPLHRREALAALADSTATWIVEDESLAWTAFDLDRPPRSIAAFAHTDRVITIGSLSKVFWGGLRVGWMRADTSVIAKVGRLRAVTDIGNSAVSQAIALNLLEHVDTLTAHRRRRLRDGLAVLRGELRDRLPEWEYAVPDGGVSLWVQLPGVRADLFAEHALRHHGVAVLPGTAASAREEHGDHLRISFAGPEEHTVEGMRRVEAAWHTFRRS